MPAGRPAGRPEISLRKSLRKSLSPAQPTPCFEKGPRSLLENGRFLRPHEAYSFAEIISFIRNLYKWNNFPHLYKWKKNNFPELIRSEKHSNEDSWPLHSEKRLSYSIAYRYRKYVEIMLSSEKHETLERARLNRCQLSRAKISFCGRRSFPKIGGN